METIFPNSENDIWETMIQIFPKSENDIWETMIQMENDEKIAIRLQSELDDEIKKQSIRGKSRFGECIGIQNSRKCKNNVTRSHNRFCSIDHSRTRLDEVKALTLLLLKNVPEESIKKDIYSMIICPHTRLYCERFKQCVYTCCICDRMYKCQHCRKRSKSN